MLALQKNIQDDGDRPELFECPPRFFQILRRHHLETRAFQIFFVDEQRLAIIFDYQNRQFRRVQLAFHVGNIDGFRCSRITDGNGNEKSRAQAYLALHINVAANQLRQFSRERKSEASALGGFLKLPLDLFPFLEDPVLIRRRDSYPGIGHRKYHRLVVTRTNRNSYFAALGELQCVGDKVSQYLRHLGFVRVKFRNANRILEHQGHRRVLRQQRPQHAAQRGKQAFDGKFSRANRDFSRFHFGQVKQVIDQVGKVLRRPPHKRHLLFLLGREISIHPVDQDLTQSQNRIQRRAEFVAHIGQKMAFQFGSALQKVGLVVQFRIEGYDPTVGFIQLPVELRQLRLPRPQFFQRPHQLFVLLLQLFVRILRGFPFNGRKQSIQFGVAQTREFVGNNLAEHDDGAGRFVRLHLKMIQKPFGSDHSEAHARLRDILSVENFVQVRNAPPTITNRHHQHFLSAVFNFEVDG